MQQTVEAEAQGSSGNIRFLFPPLEAGRETSPLLWPGAGPVVPRLHWLCLPGSCILLALEVGYMGKLVLLNGKAREILSKH